MFTISLLPCTGGLLPGLVERILGEANRSA
jgi:hypothetical protein